MLYQLFQVPLPNLKAKCRSMRSSGPISNLRRDFSFPECSRALYSPVRSNGQTRGTEKLTSSHSVILDTQQRRDDSNAILGNVKQPTLPGACSSRGCMQYFGISSAARPTCRSHEKHYLSACPFRDLLPRGLLLTSRDLRTPTCRPIAKPLTPHIMDVTFDCAAC